ncbi:hypothetical protein AB0F71_10400 [Kitasatospora sp. NPDC028055]|uniref:hypothetical protein n=1 Tax=Kitasatospora sp. NPDC028055 TaxID=3155653 RepID=UPI0033C65197
MALVKKGSRRIVVDGVEYRWRMSRKHWCCDIDASTLGYVVEDAARPGTTLVVETGRPEQPEPQLMPAEVVLPAEVAAGIRAARSQGWTPTAAGSPFQLRHSAVRHEPNEPQGAAGHRDR